MEPLGERPVRCRETRGDPFDQPGRLAAVRDPQPRAPLAGGEEGGRGSRVERGVKPVEKIGGDEGPQDVLRPVGVAPAAVRVDHRRHACRELPGEIELDPEDDEPRRELGGRQTSGSPWKGKRVPTTTPPAALARSAYDVAIARA